MRAILIISFLFITEILIAQSFNVNLSEKHLKKLQTYQSGHQRLKQYYKFYKKDSVERSRRLNKKYRRELDSAFRAEVKRDRLRRRLTKQGVKLPINRMSYADGLDREINRHWRIMSDSSLSDSVKALAKLKLKKLVVEKAQLNPGYQRMLNISAGSDSLSWLDITTEFEGLDTLSALFHSSPEEFLSAIEHAAEEAMMHTNGFRTLSGDFNEAQQLRDLPETYRRRYQSYASKDSLRETAKQHASTEAIKLFEEHASINGAQQQVSKVMSKYREFVNSSDLSSATRRTSMEGKSFHERLVIGGNFNVVSTEPLSIDFSPQLGYKFNMRFFMGIGMNYRTTFGDSIKNSYYVSPSNTSYKAFISYDVIKAFYAFGEWEKSGIVRASTDKTSKQWKDNYFIGIGKRFLVLPKLYFTMTVLYNLNGDDQNPVHPNRFQLRMGFQLSELALRKPQAHFHPNRQ